MVLEKGCPVRDGIENGISFCSDGSSPGSQCNYECDSGYALVGESFIICDGLSFFFVIEIYLFAKSNLIQVKVTKIENSFKDLEKDKLNYFKSFLNSYFMK